jgi:hypothetical protein
MKSSVHFIHSPFAPSLFGRGTITLGVSFVFVFVLGAPLRLTNGNFLIQNLNYTGRRSIRNLQPDRKIEIS